MVEFTDVPAGTKVPFLFVEFDASRAQQGPAIQEYRVLVFGQRLAAGSVLELQPTDVFSADQAGEYFGRGSSLHGMARTLFENNRVQRATFVALDDPAGTQAAGSFTVTGPATSAGTLACYVAGRRIAVAVASGDDANTIAAALAAAINADDSLPATAAATLGVVDVTARHTGVIGDEIDLRTNYLAGERFPAGVSVAIVAMTGGTGVPDVSGVFGVLGDTHYNVWASAYNDAASLALLVPELEDRFGPQVAREAVCFLCVEDTVANLLTFAASVDTQVLCAIGKTECPTPSYEVAAGVAGLAAFSAAADPARPFTTLEVRGVVAPPEAERYDFNEADALLKAGISTLQASSDGTVRVQRLVTTYKTNASGAPDDAYETVNSVFTLSYIRFSTRTHFAARYGRAKLADDASQVGAGQAIITPAIARAEMVSLFRGWQALGIVEDVEQFTRDLVVERNAQDPTRLDFLLSPDLVNQFYQGAFRVQFLI